MNQLRFSGNKVHGVAGDEPLQVVHRDTHQATPALFRGPADMGSDQAVLRTEQRIVLCDRFTGSHIESCRIDLPAVEGVGKILLHDQRSP